MVASRIPGAAAGEGVAGVGPQVRAAERQGVRHGGGIMVGGAQEGERVGEPVVLRPPVRPARAHVPRPAGPAPAVARPLWVLTSPRRRPRAVRFSATSMGTTPPDEVWR